MIELTNSIAQIVEADDRVLFDRVIVHSGCAERHREGSGAITLTKPGKYKVSFSGNIAVPTGGTIDEVALALMVDGDVLTGTIMRVTPAAVEEYFNVSTVRIVDVYCGSSVTIAVENYGIDAALVDNPNLLVVRVA